MTTPARIKELNYDSVDDEGVMKAENDNKKTCCELDKFDTKTMNQITTETLTKKDIEACTERVVELNHNDSSRLEDPKDPVVVKEEVKYKKINRMVELNNYFPHGLSGVNSPTNTNVLYLFRVRRPLNSIYFERNDKYFDTSSLMEIVYIKDPKICYDSIYFFPEYYEVQENPPIDSKPLMTMRPATEETDPSGIMRKEWPVRFNAMSINSFYEKMFNDSKSKITKPLPLKIYYKDQILAFYLKIDKVSINTLSTIRSPELSWLFRNNYVLGNTSIQESKIYSLFNTFDYPEAIVPPGFDLVLRDYQLKTISWMNSIESAESHENNTIFHNTIMDNEPFNLKLKLGHTSYYMDMKEHLITKSSKMPDTAPLRFSGGILTNDTGSGKLVTVLGLIHSTPLPLERGQDFNLNSRANCIICPANQYQKLLNEAIRCCPQLKIIGLSTMKNYQNMSWNDFKQADIIVVSHQFLKNEKYQKIVQDSGPNFSSFAHHKHYFTRIGDVILHGLHFHRIILYEFNELDYNKELIRKQVQSMKADFIWGLTSKLEINRLSSQLAYFKNSYRFQSTFDLNCNFARNEFEKKFIRRIVPSSKQSKITK